MKNTVSAMRYIVLDTRYYTGAYCYAYYYGMMKEPSAE